VLGLVLVVTSAAIASVIPWLLRRAIDGMRAGAPPDAAWWTAGVMIVTALVAGAMRFGMRELLNGVSRRIETDLRDALFAHLLSLDAAWFGRTRTGEIMARLTNDLGAVRMVAGPAIMYLVNTIAGGVFALVFMISIDWRLTAASLLPMVLLPVVMVRVGRMIHDRFEAVQAHFGTLTTHAQENISGVRVVRAYRQEPAEIRRFSVLNDEYRRLNMRLVKLYGAMNPSFALLAGLGAVAVLGVGGTLALRGRITVGAFVAFGLYLGMLTWPLIALGWVINLFQRGAASMARLNELFDARPTVSATARGGQTATLPPTGSGRTLEFRGVWFHYPTPDGEVPRWVLEDVSFTVPAGATLGVVGATGSGKSALVDLVPRLHDPQRGEILLDGVPIRDLPLDVLRAEIGYVPQESLLFSDTIAANVQYGTPGGAHVEAGRWAAGVAQLESTIRDFPGGFETILGERGINLSGGQKQRAALARALARRPAIVLLDDALSAVDTHTEAEILHALRDALAGRTAVITSHRISAIRDANWIIVLDRGRIVEQGRHDSLIAAEGRYWSLLRRQQLVEAIEEEG
jgi:ATP-binding cassette subfamily B protein